MRISTSYKELNAMVNEINFFLSCDYPTVKVLAENRLERFKKENSPQINHLLTTTNKLHELYVEKNDESEYAEKGIFKYKKEVVEVNGQPQEIPVPVFKDDESAVKYKAAWDELMIKPCSIVL